MGEPSRLYNYFLSYWQINTAEEGVKRQTIANAVVKGYITQEEADAIFAE